MAGLAVHRLQCLATFVNLLYLFKNALLNFWRILYANPLGTQTRRGLCLPGHISNVYGANSCNDFWKRATNHYVSYTF